MKKIILASAILLLASCQKEKELSRDKVFFVESKDSVLGCFHFAGRHLSMIHFENNGEKFGGNPSYNWDLSLDLTRSGDSLFVKQQTEIVKDKYGRPVNAGYEVKFLTILLDEGNLDESLLIQNINDENLFNLEIPAEKITVKGK